MSDSKRKFPRYEVDALVDLTGHEVLLYHRIQNLSLGGLCIHTATPEPVGTIVDVVVSFPAQSQTLTLKGEVVWCNLEPPRDIGIRWLDISDDQRATLKAYLEKIGVQER